MRNVSLQPRGQPNPPAPHQPSVPSLSVGRSGGRPREASLSLTKALVILCFHFLFHTDSCLLDARLCVSTVPEGPVSHNILHVKGKLMGIISEYGQRLILGSCLTGVETLTGVLFAVYVTRRG